MKIQPKHFIGRGPDAAKRSEGGMVTVVFIALLAIMLVLVTVESRALFQLHREVKLLEQQQLKRLNPPNPPPTNPVVTATSAIP
jgi:hypothetical protein